MYKDSLRLRVGTGAAAVPEEELMKAIPKGAALRRARDTANMKMFHETEKIVNGDVDVNQLCVDIRATVTNATQLRAFFKDENASVTYRIHFVV